MNKNRSENQFRAHPDGWIITVNQAERLFLAQAIEEVIELLDAPVLPFDIGDYLLDKEPGLGSDFTVEHQGEQSSLGRLLPAASADQKLAGEFDQLTKTQLCTLKTDRLQVILSEVQAPSGPETDQILVPSGQELIWLAGLNDVRLAISARLKITDLPRHEELLEIAKQWSSTQDKAGLEGVSQEADPLALLLYAQLYRWQDSLLTRLEESARTDNLE